MKTNSITIAVCFELSTSVLFSVADKPAKAGSLKFRVQQLCLHNNEGCAVADFNKDGKLDVSVGEFWYAGPDFKTPRPLRKLAPQPPDCVTNNADHTSDVNGDGWPDIISGSFLDREVAWYENPTAENLDKGGLWTRHLLIDTVRNGVAWQLYNLAHDIGEEKDLAPGEAKRVAEIISLWTEWNAKQVEPLWK